jgi:biotin operon repressor
LAISSKYQIYAAVLKQTAPFKAVLIQQLTGLSRQLIHHHLTTLCDEGYLEKDKTFYSLVARNDLLDLITSASDLTYGKLEKQTAYLGNIGRLNDVAESLVLLRNARVTGHVPLRNRVNSQIDEAIESLKGLKRWINGKQIDSSRAVTQIENQLDWLWDTIGEGLMLEGISRAEFEKDLLSKEGLVKRSVVQ